MSVILGINAFHAGSSAAVLIDGIPVAAVTEERLSRIKYHAAFPKLSVQRCLQMAGASWRDIDAVAIGRDSSANLSKKLQYALRHPTKLLNLLKINSAREQLDDVRSLVASECGATADELRFKQFNIEHHLAHTASAYFISPWDSCAGITIDGSGDFVTSMLSSCYGTRIEVKSRIYVPQSLGSLYTMLCQFIGYSKYGEEGKVMGLAPLGSDRYIAAVDKMVRLTGGGLELDPSFFLPFGDNQGLSIAENGEMIVHRHYSEKVVSMFGAPRERHAEITERDRDLAFALQAVFENGYMHLANMLHRMAPHQRLAMSGGCTLNSVANGKVLTETPFQETCIQPAAGDEGLALGAALYVSNSIFRENKRYVMRGSYLGPEYSEAEIRGALTDRDVRFVRCEREELIQHTVRKIAAGKVLGWFHGRMEWGPRALGNRSILAHPGLPDMKDTLNARIKHREPFRPFAPAVLAERQAEIFEHAHPSPFMLHVFRIRPAWRARLCAVNHVDNTGRLQSVTRDENSLFYDLITAFEVETGLPVLLNTSFNENEPIVCSPAEAVDCYLRTKMDALAIGQFLCVKPEQVR